MPKPKDKRVRDLQHGWIAVDIDGYTGWYGANHIGAPIPLMVDRVKHWLNDGRDVRIFTTQIFAPPNDPQRQGEAARAVLSIQKWCLANFGCLLPITCTKDFGMIGAIREISVIPNTGALRDGSREDVPNLDRSDAVVDHQT